MSYTTELGKRGEDYKKVLKNSDYSQSEQRNLFDRFTKEQFELLRSSKLSHDFRHMTRDQFNEINMIGTPDEFLRTANFIKLRKEEDTLPRRRSSEDSRVETHKETREDRISNLLENARRTKRRAEEQARDDDVNRTLLVEAVVRLPDKSEAYDFCHDKFTEHRKIYKDLNTYFIVQSDEAKILPNKSLKKFNHGYVYKVGLDIARADDIIRTEDARRARKPTRPTIRERAEAYQQKGLKDAFDDAREAQQRQYEFDAREAQRQYELDEAREAKHDSSDDEWVFDPQEFADAETAEDQAAVQASRCDKCSVMYRSKKSKTKSKSKPKPKSKKSKTSKKSNPKPKKSKKSKTSKKSKN